MAIAIEVPKTFDFFDNYNVRFVQPMERACSICMRRGEWGIDLGPADDLCDRCFLRAEQVVRNRTEQAGIAAPAQTAEPSTAVFLDGVLWESQDAYDAAHAAPDADPSDAELEALTAAAVAEAEAEAAPATENQTPPAGRRRRS